MAKETLPISFVNTALGDEFNKRREFIRHRSPEQFAERFAEALHIPGGLVALAEVPGMGDTDPAVDKRSPFLIAVASHLGKDFQILQFADPRKERQMATLGLALITKLPIINSGLLFLPQPVKDNFLTYPYGAIKATFEYSGKEVDMVVTHYDPFHKILRKRNFEKDEEAGVNVQLEAFIKFFTPRIDKAGQRVPTGVVGDLNCDEMNTPANTLVEKLRQLEYTEAITGPTIPGSSDRRADRLFVTSELSVEQVDLFDTGSDHFGISASIISV